MELPGIYRRKKSEKHEKYCMLFIQTCLQFRGWVTWLFWCAIDTSLLLFFPVFLFCGAGNADFYFERRGRKPDWVEGFRSEGIQRSSGQMRAVCFGKGFRRTTWRETDLMSRPLNREFSVIVLRWCMGGVGAVRNNCIRLSRRWHRWQRGPGDVKIQWGG